MPHLPYEPAATLVDQLLRDHVVPRIWARDVAVWRAGHGSADATTISTRLGWLEVAATMAPDLDRVTALGAAAKEAQVEAVYLLGMGGSSLSAEVVRSVYGVAEGHPNLFVLDTIDEQTITSAAARMDPERTWFAVASKSGGTIEVASMERFFWSKMSAALGDNAGRHFIAITDPGTPLGRLAERRGYREVFLNPPDIGGPFSALSLFGLVPAALVGAPVRDVLAAGAAMAEGCRQENHTNAGLELGAFVAAAVKNGRDKLTLALPPSMASLGSWIEHLVAEGTGTNGTGALPIVDEPLGHPDDYGADRAFVALATERDAPDGERLAALQAAGHPVLRLTTRVHGLGSEFFRWEFATAVAGAALGVNPFDEPNVSKAKARTTALLGEYAKSGSLPEPQPVASDGGVSVFSRRFTGASPPDVLARMIRSIEPGSYVAFLSYLAPGHDLEAAIADIRTAIRSHTRAASTLGVGPGHLHSTGQYHRGGPGAAFAVVITADDRGATPIPDAGYSFSVLKRAQALGDVETLEAHERPTIRIHVTDADAAARVVEHLFAEALK